MMSLLQCRSFGQSMYSGWKALTGIRCLSSEILSEARQQLSQMQAGTVDLKKNNDTGIAVMTLSNPKRKNAVSGNMMVEIADHVTDLSKWAEGKALILRGADGTFCSGGDLTSVKTMMDAEMGGYMSHFMHDTLTRLHSLPLVSVALLQGIAIGGGAELATACDLRVMTENARVGFVHVKMGITTGWGGATHLYAVLGRSRTLSLLGSGKTLKAQDALAYGFAEHVIPEEPSPLEAVEALLQENYCRGAVETVRALKEMIVGIENCGNLPEALALERKVFASFWGNEAHRAAVESKPKLSQ